MEIGEVRRRIMRALWMAMRLLAWLVFAVLVLGASLVWTIRPTPTSVPRRSSSTSVSPKSFEIRPRSCNVFDDTFDNIYKSGSWNRGNVRVAPPGHFYHNATWPHQRRFAASGEGSQLGVATENSMKFLTEAIHNYTVVSMIDVPCGDLNWIFDSWPTDSLDYYLGLDVARPILAMNRKRFAHHSNKIFQQWDATVCPLPSLVVGYEKRRFDLVHSRDVLQHLPLEQVSLFLCNVVKSGARLFITTTFPEGVNQDIGRGSFFKNNLQEEPFSLPAPKVCVPTHPALEEDLTCLYELHTLAFQKYVKEKC